MYVLGDVLQKHRTDKTFDIFKATSDGESFVVKRMPRAFYELSQRLADQFAHSCRLRLHIDHNEEAGILIYTYFNNTLLDLIRGDDELPGAEVQKVLRHVGEAIQEFHLEDWVHLDVKPDNILVNWSCENNGTKTVSEAALGDFDIAFRFEGIDKLNLRHAIGNAMWRSPEGQAGRGLTKASDIFSFGLVCLYALGAADYLLLDDYQELASRGVSPTQEMGMVTRHFCYFGPVPQGLFEQVDDQTWDAAFRDSAEAARQAVEDNPGLSFATWDKQLDPEAYDIIAWMTNLDPATRPSIEQVLNCPWWRVGA
ncbi:unnamed protein product [Zymoseptoria tritici ST99CH_3D7]|uniref:Protein kinase domain-containing protein n=2 Tax=Zymoseptoria tritici TaxID=1047171 RepID=A0A1X7S443_ZYMT9|nr:unnamed protein product [Zymoseptoria tritici ST99CH_3D7]